MPSCSSGRILDTDRFAVPRRERVRSPSRVSLPRGRARWPARSSASCGRVIVGQDAVIAEILTAFLAGGHCLLRGVPGLAKTLLIKTLAAGRAPEVQPHPVHARPDAVGHHRHRGDRGGSGDRSRAHPVSSPGRSSPTSSWPTRSTARRRRRSRRCSRRCRNTRSRSAACVIRSSGRCSCWRRRIPIEQEGTYPLPEAQLDRFMLNVVIDYPSGGGGARDPRADDRAAERHGVGGRDREDRSSGRGCSCARFRRPTTSSTTPRASCARPGRTRRPTTARRTSSGSGSAGAPGPRAGQALLLAGKARAVLHGRPAVSLDDVRAVAPPVLRHRLLVNFQAEADGIDAETIVRAVETVARQING